MKKRASIRGHSNSSGSKTVRLKPKSDSAGEAVPDGHFSSAGSNSRTQSQLTTVNRPIAQLKPDPLNPRIHSRTQIRQIARSIDKLGFNVPVLIDSTGKVLAGHGRLIAAQQLGLTEVPTIVLDHLSETQARAFMIADNKLTENAEWNLQLLGEQLRDLSLLDLDFDIEITGFETGEIDLMIDGAESGATSTATQPMICPQLRVWRLLSPAISGCWASTLSSVATRSTRHLTCGFWTA